MSLACCTSHISLRRPTHFFVLGNPPTATWRVANLYHSCRSWYLPKTSKPSGSVVCFQDNDVSIPSSESACLTHLLVPGNVPPTKLERVVVKSAIVPVREHQTVTISTPHLLQSAVSSSSRLRGSGSAWSRNCTRCRHAICHVPPVFGDDLSPPLISATCKDPALSIWRLLWEWIGGRPPTWCTSNAGPPHDGPHKSWRSLNRNLCH